MSPATAAIRRVWVAALRVRRWACAWFPLRDDGPLAEPWRRLAAALLDTLLVVLVSAAVAGTNLNWLSSSLNKGLIVLSASIAVGAWLYVLAGWSVGATLGMSLLGIRLARVEAAAGARIGVRCAALRVLGYWLASLPVKGGLWPVLTHPLRQGWHDQIAGTLVIKRGESAAAAGLVARRCAARDARPSIETVAGHSWLAPDWRAARRGWPLALCGLGALVALMTYPVAWHLGSRLAGAPGDSAIFYWTEWYVPFMADRHLPLLHSNYLFYPVDVSLAFTTMDWFNGFVAAPLRRVLNPIAVYNALWLGSLTLSAFAAYLLLAAVARSRAAALALAPVFGLSPYFMAHGLGHVNLISAEFLPLTALFTYAWLTTRRARYAAAAGTSWALAGWCDLQFVLFGAVIVGALLAAYWWRPLPALRLPRIRADALRHLKLLGVACACLALGLSWLIVPLARARQHGSQRYTDRMAQYAAAADDYAAPNQFLALTKAERDSSNILGAFKVENAVTPGLAAALLAFLAPLILARRARRALMPWWCLAVGAWALSFGGMITANSTAWSLACSAANAALAFPGNGFALPWHFEGMVYTGLAAVSGSWATVATLGEPAWMPYSWIWTVLPPVRAFRGTARLGVLVDLATALLAASALRAIVAGASRRFGGAYPVAPGAICAACLAWICAEYAAAPYPTYRPPLSPIVARLGQSGQDSPVLEMPLSNDPDYLIDQTELGRPVFEGFLSRTPDEVMREVAGNPLLLCAARQGGGPMPPAGRQLPAPSELDLRSAMAELYRLGVRDVIVRRKGVVESARLTNEALLLRLGAVRVDGDDAVEVFRFFGPPADPVRASARLPSRGFRKSRVKQLNRATLHDMEGFGGGLDGSV